MKRDRTKLRGALTLVVIMIIGVVIVFMAQKFALTLFHFMHVADRDFIVKVSFSIACLFIFWGVFVGLTLAFRSAFAVFKHTLSHHTTKGK